MMEPAKSKSFLINLKIKKLHALTGLQFFLIQLRKILPHKSTSFIKQNLKKQNYSCHLEPLNKAIPTIQDLLLCLSLRILLLLLSSRDLLYSGDSRPSYILVIQRPKAVESPSSYKQIHITVNKVFF